MQKWILNLLVTYFVKNWRTTVTGIVGFVVNLFPGVAAWLAAHGYSINEVNGLLLMIVAFFAKDGGVSNAPSPVPAQVVGTNLSTISNTGTSGG